MPLMLSILLEESVQIAWNYLERTGEIDDPFEVKLLQTVRRVGYVLKAE